MSTRKELLTIYKANRSHFNELGVNGRCTNKALQMAADKLAKPSTVCDSTVCDQADSEITSQHVMTCDIPRLRAAASAMNVPYTDNKQVRARLLDIVGMNEKKNYIYPGFKQTSVFSDNINKKDKKRLAMLYEKEVSIYYHRFNDIMKTLEYVIAREEMLNDDEDEDDEDYCPESDEDDEDDDDEEDVEYEDLVKELKWLRDN